jgi:hypothetical protein
VDGRHAIDSIQSPEDITMSVVKLSRFFVVVLALTLATASAFSQTVVTQSGQTSVQLSSDFLNALKSLGVTPGVLNPTTINNKAVVTFPITGGAVDAQTAAGQITHSGGLTLTAGNTQVAIENFTIDTTGSSPVLNGIAAVNGSVAGVLPLFNLALPQGFKLPLKPIAGVLVNLKGVGVTLTSTAATTLNNVFGVSAFKGGINIGTATVQAFVAPNR